MSMIVYPPKQESSWYSKGWDAYDNREALGEALWALHMNGESSQSRSQFKRGWRDAFVVDLCDTTHAPQWMKEELGI